ncbi:hypothetical protein BC628DRAFT_1424171 [Trametes gibbosa]|nr:hypothetical protein BC628DRAFT_1424171 [Trametes gibbosa]
MSYIHNPTPASSPDVMDDIRDLALQIEALHVPDSATLPMTLFADGGVPHPDAIKVKRKGSKNSKNLPKLARCTEPATALPPKISSGAEHALPDARCPTEARQHEENRSKLVALASESPFEPPELQTPVQLDTEDEPVIIWQSGETSDRLPAQTIGDPKRTGVDERDQQSKARTDEKLLIKLKPPHSKPKKRFEVEIVADEELGTIWDGDFDNVYAWSGTLVVRDRRPPTHIYTREIIQDLDIHFQAIAAPLSHPPLSTATAFHPQNVAWQTSYLGCQIRTRKDPMYVPTLDAASGIVVEKEYKFIEPTRPNGPFVWHIRFWVPVPLVLFASAEHRTFLCDASVSMHYGDEQASFVFADSVSVGIEYIRSERLDVPRELPQ